MQAGYVLDSTRSGYGIPEEAMGDGIADVAARTAWQGAGNSARPFGVGPVEEAGRRMAAEAAASLALATRHADALALTGQAALYRDLELPLARVLGKIEGRGVLLDSDYMRALGQEVGASLMVLEKEIPALAGQSFNINSNKQLGEILFGKLALPVVRKTKTGPSTDAETQEELAPLHPESEKKLE